MARFWSSANFLRDAPAKLPDRDHRKCKRKACSPSHQVHQHRWWRPGSSQRLAPLPSCWLLFTSLKCDERLNLVENYFWPESPLWKSFAWQNLFTWNHTKQPEQTHQGKLVLSAIEGLIQETVQTTRDPDSLLENKDDVPVQIDLLHSAQVDWLALLQLARHRSPQNSSLFAPAK